MAYNADQILASGDPFDEASYNAQIHRVQDSYATGMSKNTFQNQVADINKVDQLAKLKLGYERSEGGFRSGFASRGLRYSGGYGEQYGQREADYGSARNDITRNWGLHKYGLFNEQQGIQTQYGQRPQQDIELLRQGRRQSVAASLS